MAATVDEWLSGLPPGRRETAEAVRALVREAAPDATETMKWGMPCYVLNGNLCSIEARARGEYVRLQLFRGAEIEAVDSLEGTGRGMRHLKIDVAGPVPRARIRAALIAAAELHRGGDRAAG